MEGYIMELRRLVGHRTLIQTAASVIIEDGEGRILLGRRSDNGKWDYSGGSLEIDERVEDCARRELFEEMGLYADGLEFFMINSGPETHYIYPNGDEVSNVEIIYTCSRWHGEPVSRDGEMTELRWFSVGELPEDISEPVMPVIREYVRRKGQ